MTAQTVVFDAYGTLFDVNAAARQAASEPGQSALAAVWPKLAADWRAKQLEYTWLRAVAGQHCDFWQVTQDGLDWALEASDLDDPALRERLLALYWELDAFAEVPDMLAALKSKEELIGEIITLLQSPISNIVSGLQALRPTGLCLDYSPRLLLICLVSRHDSCTLHLLWHINRL